MREAVAGSCQSGLCESVEAGLKRMTKETQGLTGLTEADAGNRRTKCLGRQVDEARWVTKRARPKTHSPQRSNSGARRARSMPYVRKMEERQATGAGRAKPHVRDLPEARPFATSPVVPKRRCARGQMKHTANAELARRDVGSTRRRVQEQEGGCCGR